MPADGATTRANLRRRVSVVVAALLGLVVVASILCGLLVRAWDRSIQERGQARIAADQVSDLRLAYSDQETGIRGFILTGDDTFLDPYREGSGLARAMQTRLRAHSSLDGIGLESQLARVEAAAELWQQDVAEVALDPSRPAPDEELGRERFNSVRDELDRLDQLVVDELNLRIERTDDLQRVTIAMLLASSLMAIAAIVLLAVLFRRWVTRPLSTIAASARTVAIDDSTDLPDFDSAELQEVVEAIRTLQRSLARERDRALTAYQGLEQSALLALHVRSELADALGDPPPGWGVSSALVPAEGLVAGDCYDLGLLDQHRMYVVVVDVTGHGAAAALDALKAKSQLRAALRSRLSPGAALEWLSRENAKDERADLLTAVVAVVDVDTGVCQYANAGHPAPLLLTDEERLELGATGPLLGAFPASWTTQSVTIAPGSTLLLHTDGVTEALGPGRERFGEQRFVDCLTDADVSDPAHVVNDVLEAVRVFRDGPRNDDLTLVALHRRLVVATDKASDASMATVRS